MPLKTGRKARLVEQATYQTSADDLEFRQIKTELLLEPLNPARETFDDVKLQDLIMSIQQVGVIEPLCVEPEGDRYRVHAGHRRLVAGRAAGLEELPCRIFPAGALNGEAIKHHENKMREDLNAAEEARHFSSLLKTECAGDVDQLCRLVIERREYVEERLNLIQGDEQVFQALADSAISIGVAKELNRVTDSARRHMYLDAAMVGGASIRMVRDWRIRGNQLDELQVTAQAPLPDGPRTPYSKPITMGFECYLCRSSEDPHDMELLYVHRSCARAVSRLAKADAKNSPLPNQPQE